ncbi:fatty acid--CoA ligase [Croceicoccus estronivorus]|uniref:FadD3 family acyl-CoA ligase n=1 Tax=Croceicoccus estronivorus TaxID=1172626 RepID=UPI000834DFE4|nr:FadD3 family acyl-CoA ligase [Croceicoccus estronivorus]OCC22610.1 fatty acid--CoA ligase [Croceicoccus estronivorus]
MAEGLPLTIPHAAALAARRWGDAPALVEHGETWSFNELWARCRAAASALLARGVEKGDRVAIWAPNSREWIVAAVGLMTCGATLIPINTRLKGHEAGDILRRTHSRLLFTVKGFLDIDYPALLAAEDLPELAETVLLDSEFSEFVASGNGADDPAVAAAFDALTPDIVSDMIFTSGTTGAPKGVMMTYGRVIPQCEVWIENTGLSRGERYLIVNPFFHSFGFKVGWVASLIAGAVMYPLAQFDVKEVIRLIEQERINFFPAPPTVFQTLLAERERHPFDCSSLRGGTSGSTTVPPILIERIRSELGMQDITTAYGMSEYTVITSCRRGDPADVIANSVGCALPGTEVKIVDPGGQEVPRGDTGEIWVRGPSVMLGYLDDPVATAEAIDGNGWLHTGDVGTMDETGYVRITDRLKDMYISGGFNVYPAEVEALLSRHPAIATVAVVGIPDERLGEVGKAFVILRPDMQVDQQDLLAWAKDNMANYKVPRSVAFVADFPRNAAGKVLKDKLRD